MAKGVDEKEEIHLALIIRSFLELDYEKAPILYIILAKTLLTTSTNFISVTTVFRQNMSLQTDLSLAEKMIAVL